MRRAVFSTARHCCWKERFFDRGWRVEAGTPGTWSGAGRKRLPHLNVVERCPAQFLSERCLMLILPRRTRRCIGKRRGREKLAATLAPSISYKCPNTVFIGEP